MKNKLHKASGKDLSSLLFADSAISLFDNDNKNDKNQHQAFLNEFFLLSDGFF